MGVESVLVEKLNQHKIGIGTAIVAVIVLMWGAYQVGTFGWDTLNLQFVDHAEAQEYITRTESELLEANKNIRLMESKSLDLEIDKAKSKGDEDVIAAIDIQLLRLNKAIKDEERRIKCLKGAPDCLM
jgi:hypothetical protein